LTAYTRGVDNTTEQAHGAGTVVEYIWSGADLNDLIDGILEQHDQQGFHKFAAPEGFLINGKIVPSVASNNLTVALKGLDGNDPSATNPIYIRIGDTVHSITSALSVTKNAGTNWFNAGSSELATKEIDYFVYLGYNATDGVVIGFSRIPYATEYSQFSAITTNEKYCAISTITNAAAGDDYVVIGRFAATLSAGAGYTWTVPTFNSKNLIQRPIFETRVLSWTPTYSCLGSMTYTSVNSHMGTRSGYRLVGSTMHISLYANGTTGGTASNTIYATMPFSVGLVYQQVGFILRDGSYDVGRGNVDNANKLAGMKMTSATNWGLGASREAQWQGAIELRTP
jgi:hypothetical protein